MHRSIYLINRHLSNYLSIREICMSKLIYMPLYLCTCMSVYINIHWVAKP